MTTQPEKENENQFTRRDVVAGALKTMLVAAAMPLMETRSFAAVEEPRRVINIMNFIRADEPREPMDLITPVREQMALIKAHKFPATWLLQYDALVMGPFVEFLKAEMPPDHEVGVWFEMNRKIVDDAGLVWRGNPDWEWDYHVPVAYSIGYTADERRKLADTAAATFKRVFGKDVKSIASWNLDAVTTSHFADHYDIDAFGNCRDQLATDGFTIWGAPIAAYYPNRVNAWSPAVDAKNQIATPMFRLLGQDPVYYYDNTIHYPDTMEPVWPSGQSEVFVDRFLDMIAHAPTQAFGYAQLGQENSFGWPQMGKGFAMQMKKLAEAQSKDGLVVETMGETGRRFKRTFKSTPTQAQVMLEDPFGHTDNPERTVWYQSKFLRANLHFRGSEFYLRDLHVYDDRFPQPFLTEVVTKHGIEQRLLAVLDGFHWSDDKARNGQAGGLRAKGKFVLIGKDGAQTALTMDGLPTVTEKGSTMVTSVPLSGGGRVDVTFKERDIELHITDRKTEDRLGLVFEWAADHTALTQVAANRLSYRFQNFDYGIGVENGAAAKTDGGVNIVADGVKPLRLVLAQIA